MRKKMMVAVVVSLVAVCVSLPIGPQAAWAAGEYDFVEYDVDTGETKDVLYSEVTGQSIPSELQASAPVAAQASMGGIIGSEDRKAVSTPDRYPYAPISKIVANASQGSGVMVYSDTLLTCAHAVWSSEKGFAKDVQVIPGSSISTPKPFGTVKAKKIYVLKKYLENPHTSYDIAVVKLKEEVGNQTGWYGIKPLAISQINDDQGLLTVTGYPGMYYGDMVTETRKEWLFGFAGQSYLTGFDFTPGQSGSPLYNQKNQVLSVMTAFTNDSAGVTQASMGTMISPGRYEMIYHLINRKIDWVVESVALNEAQINLFPKETKQLKATVFPNQVKNKTVAWASSDVSVATVGKDGLVRAVGEGQAIITVTTEDGAKTAECKVTVGDDHSNSMKLGRGTLLALDVVTTGRIDYEGDIDVFQMDLPANALYAIKNVNVTRGLSSVYGSGVVVYQATVNGVQYEGLETGAEPASFTRSYKGEMGADYQIVMKKAKRELPTILNKDQMKNRSLKIGATAQIEAVANNGAYPEALTYRVDSRHAFVTVDEKGVVTAINPGTANVIVKDAITGLSALVSVTVAI